MSASMSAYAHPQGGSKRLADAVRLARAEILSRHGAAANATASTGTKRACMTRWAIPNPAWVAVRTRARPSR